MRLSKFLNDYQTQIIMEWESFAKKQTPAADKMDRSQLRDHIVELLSFIAHDIESAQTDAQQIAKSFGENDIRRRSDSAAEIHGELRHDDGFDIIQMVSEYRALRASVTKLWIVFKKVLSDEDVLALVRFNESIDQALAESTARFMEKVDYSKDLLLGVLGHDIRSPLGAIQSSAMLLPRLGNLNDKQSLLVAQMEGSGLRINKIVSDLLDLTRTRMETKLPIRKSPTDIQDIATQIIAEMHIQNPQREIRLETIGNVSGEWDAVRLGQVFSNIIGNAIQYGACDAPITVILTGNANNTAITFHNEGIPIAAAHVEKIFKSFTRGDSDGLPQDAANNLGLGLFIAREIVSAHGGTIQVASTAESGTTFTVLLPR